MSHRRNLSTRSDEDVGVQQHNADTVLRSSFSLPQNSHDNFQANFNVLQNIVQY